MKKIILLITTMLVYSVVASAQSASGDSAKKAVPDTSKKVIADKSNKINDKKKSQKFKCSNSIINYDFLKDSVGKYKRCVCDKGTITINVENINRFMYDVTLITKAGRADVNMQNDDPKEIAKQEFTVTQNNSLKGLEINQLPMLLNIPNELTEEIQTLISKRNDKVYYLPTQIDSAFATISKAPSFIEKNLSKIIYYTQLTNDYLTGVSGYEIYYNDLFRILHTETNDIKELIDLRDKSRKILLGHDLDSLKNYISNYDYWIKQNFSVLISTYKSLEMEINNLSENDKKKYKDFLTELQSNLKEIEKSNKTFNEFDFEKLGNEIIYLDGYFIDKYFKFNETIEPEDADRVFVDLKITPKKTDGGIQSKTQTFKFDIRKGVKLDFSPGFFFNINLNDKSYFADTTGRNPLDTAYTIIRKSADRNMFVPAIGIMLHVYERKCRNTTLAGSFGITSENGKTIKYYLGGSLIIGKKERFIISAGAAGGSVKRLDGDFKVDEKYPITKVGENVKTTDVFRIGGFFGICYNISALVNQKKGSELFSQ